MARPWTMQRMTDEFVALLGKEPDEVAGNELFFRRGDLTSKIAIRKDPHDRSLFDWATFTYDVALCDAMAEYGAMSLQITPADRHPYMDPPRHLWPTGSESLDPATVEHVRTYGLPSVRFVRNRRDFGRLLLADGNVRRGDLSAFTPPQTETARLAKAILLARHAGYNDLERAAIRKLRKRGEERTGGPDDLFRHSVAYCAKDYAKATGVDLSDLQGLRRKRPVYPEPMTSS